MFTFLCLHHPQPWVAASCGRVSFVTSSARRSKRTSATMTSEFPRWRGTAPSAPSTQSFWPSSLNPAEGGPFWSCPSLRSVRRNEWDTGPNGSVTKTSHSVDQTCTERCYTCSDYWHVWFLLLSQKMLMATDKWWVRKWRLARRHQSFSTVENHN